MMQGLRFQKGQAMTEFTVAAAFVVVPLFIIVPVVGKYIDMKQTAVEAARYAAWEYTANYGRSGDQPLGFKSYSAAEMPVKSLRQVEHETERRFYSNTSIPIDSNADQSGYQVAAGNPFWRYHNGLPMYQPAQSGTVALSGPRDTPDTLGIARGFVRAFGGITGFIARLLDKIGVPAGFDAINTRGKFTASGSLPVQPAPLYAGFQASNQKPLFLQPLNLEMTAKAAVVGESWSAGGKAHTVYQAGGLIPTVLLDQALNGLVPIQSIASTILISPELGPDSLRFGYPTRDPQVMDEVPPEKLKDDGRSVECDPGGYCVY